MNPRTIAIALPLSLAALVPALAGEKSPYKMQRAEEDWSFLRDDNAATGEPHRAMKFLALSPDRNVWVSFGADARLRFERFENPFWGDASEDDNGYWLQRYFLHADLHLGEHVRVFGQLMRSSEDG